MKINIKGKPYKVKFVENTFLSGDTPCVGIINYEKQEIKIANHDREQTPRTIYHELLHGFLKECGLNNYASDETLVDWFANNIQEINSCAAAMILKAKEGGKC